VPSSPLEALTAASTIRERHRGPWRTFSRSTAVLGTRMAGCTSSGTICPLGY
jgi:hypothetical protein